MSVTELWGGLAVLIPGGLAAIGLYYTIRAQGREQEQKVAEAAAKAQSDRDTFGRDKFNEGVASRQDTVDRLMAQLADAWKDRDLARSEAARWENRYLNLRDGQTPRDDRDRRDATDNREASP